MANEKIELTIAEMSRTMANAVLRERRRCAKVLTDRSATLQETEERRALAKYLDDLAEIILTPPVATVVPTASLPTVGEAAPVEAEPVDELPPHRDRDDFEDGVSLVRGMTSFGRRVPSAGLPTD